MPLTARWCERGIIISTMLPSRRVTVTVPIATRIAGTLAMLVMLAMLVGLVIFVT